MKTGSAINHVQSKKAQGLPHCGTCDQYSMLKERVEPHLPSVIFNPELLRSAQSIGIVEMGGLGSILRTSAVVKAIRERNSTASIYWFSHEAGVELVRYIPGITPIHIMTEFDLQIDVLINFEINPLVKKLIRTATSVAGFTLNEVGQFEPASVHATELQRLQIDDTFRRENTKSMQQILLNTIGLSKSTPHYFIELTQQNEVNANLLCEKYGIPSNKDKTVIGLNIGTSKKGKLKRWPVRNFVEVARLLQEAYPNAHFCFFSGPEDEELRTPLTEYLSNVQGISFSNLNGLEVGDFMAMVGKMSMMVTADTFGMHASFMQQIPTIVLAGPMPSKEIEASKQDRIITADFPCAPCYYRCRRQILGECMEIITPLEVTAIAQGMLGLTQTSE